MADFYDNMPSYVQSSYKAKNVPDKIWDMWGDPDLANDPDLAKIIKQYETIMNMSPTDALEYQWKKNPWGISMNLAGGVMDTGMSIWNAFQKNRYAKQAMDLANKDYELKRQAYEANEARNKERFDWLRQSRATSQL